MSVCLVCLNETEGNQAQKYCHKCSDELDKRYKVELARLKSDLRKTILNKMIVEHAAKLENSKHISQHAHCKIKLPANGECPGIVPDKNANQGMVI